LGEIVAIKAWAKRIREKFFFGEDASLVITRHKNGSIGKLLVSFAIGQPAEEVLFFQIYGKEGSLIGEGTPTGQGNILLCKKGKSREYKIEETDPISFTFRAEIAHFLECILEDKEPLITGKNGRRDLELVITAYKSIDSGKEEKVKSN